MRHLVVQGGTDGIGRELALSHLRRGDHVLVLGRDRHKGAKLLEVAHGLGAGDRASFIAVDLSTIGDNVDVIEEIKSRFDRIDALVLCARHYSWRRRETVDGLEGTFALFYLSRFLLCHGLVGLLEQAETPVIMNVAGPGGSLDSMHWDDLGLRRGYDGQQALQQCGVANDLLGVSFSEQHHASGVRYVLINPGMVSTSFSGEYDAATAAQIASMKRMGMPVSQAVEPLLEIIDSPPAEALSAFSAGALLNLSASGSFDVGAARRLNVLTRELLDRTSPNGSSATKGLI